MVLKEALVFCATIQKKPHEQHIVETGWSRRATWPFQSDALCRHPQVLQIAGITRNHLLVISTTLQIQTVWSEFRWVCFVSKKKIHKCSDMCHKGRKKAVIFRVKRAANCHGHLNLQRQPAPSAEPVHHCGDESVVVAWCVLMGTANRAWAAVRQINRLGRYWNAGPGTRTH